MVATAHIETRTNNSVVFARWRLYDTHLPLDALPLCGEMKMTNGSAERGAVGEVPERRRGWSEKLVHLALEV